VSRLPVPEASDLRADAADLVAAIAADRMTRPEVSST
jgi:hypothetical protein